ncbi:MAG: 5-(carboxyamino)imidazole ribonucleotide synthase [Planctomycetota bacterium]|nr:5-(carboxyamino)imidazole ribonucleotide synthase [Planctomycetaceae bacterium]MDQ3332000.1 5-(carboxyamino)imidazole ribonucleotide synthase [Planctomycetota bacterium]
MSLPPGSTLGVFGSGQLGRMFAFAARRMGYRVHVFSSDRDTPAGQVADVEVVADYDDATAIASFCRLVQAVTFEFENVPATVAQVAEQFVPVRPSGSVLHLCQHRLREKTALREAGLPVPAFAAVRSLAELRVAAESIGCPAVLKTATSGYDGKGQIKITGDSDLNAVWNELRTDEAIYEAFVSFEKELSVIGVRGVDGSMAFYGPIENEHRDHILDISRCPAHVPESVSRNAVELARAVLEALDVVGVLCVELFMKPDGGLLINELAPRPHNSGHLTIEAFATSQFEQQVRAVAGLPVGSAEQLRPTAMANLLGEAWFPHEPRWDRALDVPGVALHLYGKAEAKPGRKMGHLTATADDIDEAVRRVVAARDALQPQ